MKAAVVKQLPSGRWVAVSVNPEEVARLVRKRIRGRHGSGDSSVEALGHLLEQQAQVRVVDGAFEAKIKVEDLGA